jgi:hypothetical protein
MTCPWPMPEGDCLPADWNTLPEPMRARGQQLASRTMEWLTAGQVGMCPVTIRPTPRAPRCAPAYDAMNIHGSGSGVVNWNGEWLNCGCGGAHSLCEVDLPAPVGRIDSVKVGATVLSADDYEIQDGHYLVWTGTGDCPFPRGNTEVLEVTYVNAYLPEPDGLSAYATLAYEFAKACAGKQCRLPSGVTNIVRQGISMNITPGSFPNGKTGINDVDAYLGQWNPHGLLIPSQVWSPDLPTHRVIGG